MRYWFIAFFIFLLTPLISFAGIMLDRHVPWCLDRDPSTDIEQLKCLQNLEEAQALKLELHEFIRKKRICSKCKSSVIDGDKYSSLFDSPYIVIAITLTRMITGMDVHVVFKKQPFQEYRIWLDYETESYTLGAIDARPQSREMKKLLKRLQDQRYNDLWVKGLD